ncbi:MAG TPA: hypothetical protein VIB62_06335 [Actinomycetota bacterium]
MTARSGVRAALAAAFLLGVACTSDDPTSSAPASSVTATIDPATFAAQVPSTDLYLDAPQRVQVGVFASDEDQGILLLTSGSIEARLTPFEDGPGTPVEGTADYVPAPFTDGSADDPLTLTAPSQARGVYQLTDVTFDAAGIWQADISFELEGRPIELTTQFQVLERPHLPAPGDPALRTDSLTMDSDVPPAAIDSRAVTDGQVPDPELHAESIAQAIRRGQPIVALFATPVYCTSQFCGPDVEWLAELASQRPDDAAYIHVEIWADHTTESQTLNQAAVDWLYRDDNLTEPWLFVIDADGTIVDRWAPLFDPAEVEAALDAVTQGPA